MNGLAVIRRCWRFFAVFVSCLALSPRLGAEVYVTLVDVPDYDWYGGCFGTACCNLMGYWDRHGFPDFYTNGLAPLNSYGANSAVFSMSVSKAHLDDYWSSYQNWRSYEDPGADPYVMAHRPEHTPDCIGDFIGLSQKKWTNMNNECDGNIDAYSFVYWDAAGNRRTNFAPSAAAGTPARDIQSGLREWTRWRGFDADVFTQLTDFNPNVPSGHGFTFADMKAEIDAGYPVLLYLQPFNELSRNIPPMTKANPEIHGMMAYGYWIWDDGTKNVVYRTSWASGDHIVTQWSAQIWQAELPVRGVIGYHPKPKVRSVTRTNGTVTVTWDGPSSQLVEQISDVTTPLHFYVLERAPALNGQFRPITDPSTNRTATVPDCCGTAFFRVRLVMP